jgi:metal-sulfur cluster biosynthetic enzyme
MPTITESQVTQALSHVIEPELHKDLVTLKMIENVKMITGRRCVLPLSSPRPPALEKSN